MNMIYDYTVASLGSRLYPCKDIPVWVQYTFAVIVIAMVDGDITVCPVAVKAVASSVSVWPDAYDFLGVANNLRMF